MTRRHERIMILIIVAELLSDGPVNVYAHTNAYNHSKRQRKDTARCLAGCQLGSYPDIERKLGQCHARCFGKGTKL